MTDITTNLPEKVATHTGASLRDVIAIAAMQGLLANDPRCMEFSEIPRLSYEYADAMLIARAKENGA